LPFARALFSSSADHDNIPTPLRKKGGGNITHQGISPASTPGKITGRENGEIILQRLFHLLLSCGQKIKAVTIAQILVQHRNFAFGLSFAAQQYFRHFTITTRTVFKQLAVINQLVNLAYFGKTNREIAKEMDVTEKSVVARLKRIYKKLRPKILKRMSKTELEYYGITTA
jgi:predicted DNA-binding transcriptional regulator